MMRLLAFDLEVLRYFLIYMRDSCDKNNLINELFDLILLEQVMQEVEVINSWSTPRSLSTSLMYSFSQRDDMEVLDEPLYANYCRLTGIDVPYREELFSTMEADGDKVIKDIISRPGEKKYRYCKHIANQIISCSTSDLLKKGKHFILIRDPLDVLPSFDKVAPATFLELGFADLVSIYSQLCDLGKPPPIIDAAELQQDPEAVLRGLCEDLDIPFQAAMLKWEAGPKPIDGLWAPWWYKSVHNSTCFFAGRKYPQPFPLHLYDLLEQCLPFFNMLKRQTRSSLSCLNSKPNLLVPTTEKLFAWIDNKIVPRDEAKVSVFDSVVQGGDSVWEGLRVYSGKIFKLHEHINRLFDSAKALDFSNVPTHEEVKEAIFKTLIINGMFDNVRIRLMLTGGKKVPFEMNSDYNRYGCTLIVLPEWESPVNADSCGISLKTATVHRLSPNKKENKAKADDTIVLDEDDFVSEKTAMNLVFLVKKNHVSISNIDPGLLRVTWATIMDLVAKENLPIEQRQISLSELCTANEVWITTIREELIPVVKIDDRVIGNGEVGNITRRLQVAYRNLTMESGVLIPTYQTS